MSSRLAVVALTLVLLGSMATLAAARCERAVSTGLAACVQRVAARSAHCHLETGTPCAADDPRVVSALGALARRIRQACPDGPAVQAAGYPPLFEPETLIDRARDACVANTAALDARTFGGPHAAVFATAEPVGRHCLLEAQQRAATLLKKALRLQGRCVATERAGRGCNLDRTLARLADLERKTETATASDCADLAALTGLTPARFVRRAGEQARCMVATAHPDPRPLALDCGPRAEAAPPPRGVWTQIVLDEAVWGTRCGDGSSYAFWLRLAPAGAPIERVVINLAGGGACLGGPQCASVPSSLFRATDDVQPSGGHLNTTAAVNPFHDWTLVHLPYCTQDVHIGGGRTSVFAADGVTVHRFGAINVRATIGYLRDVLWAALDTEDAAGYRPDRLRVVFAGESAGGFGVQYLYHHLLDELGWTHTTAVPDSGLALDNGEIVGVLGFSLVMASESGNGWGSGPYLPPYCNRGPCAIGPVLQAASSPRLGTVPAQMFLNVSNQVDDTQQVTTLFPTRASWVNELRASYCLNRGLPGVRYFLPARTTSTHTLLRSNTFMTSLTADGVVMGDWLAGAMNASESTVDRVEEGSLVTSVAGVLAFPCPLGG